MIVQNLKLNFTIFQPRRLVQYLLKSHFPINLGRIAKETLVHIAKYAKYADDWLSTVGGSLDILESKVCRTMA